MRVVTVQAKIRDDALRAFLDASVANGRASTATEQGCRRFDVFQDKADPRLVGFTEIYNNDDAVAAHGESSHFAAWLGAVDGMAEGEMIWATCRSLFTGAVEVPDSPDDAADEGPAGGRYIYQGRFRVHPAELDGFVAALTAQASTSLRTEPGCLRFDVCENIDDPTEIWIYEVYADHAAYLQHRDEPHSIACRSELDGKYDSPPDSVSGPNVWPLDDSHWGA